MVLGNNRVRRIALQRSARMEPDQHQQRQCTILCTYNEKEPGGASVASL